MKLEKRIQYHIRENAFAVKDVLDNCVFGGVSVKIIKGEGGKMIKKFKSSLKYIKLQDIVDIIIFLLVFIPALLYKLYLKIIHKNLILICEEPNEARDNGYHLFQYIRKNYPDDPVYYAIHKKSKDYLKIKELGNIIEFHSFKHWLYYLAANVNISTHKSGNPSPALFYVLQVSGLLKNKRVFLQHGITMNYVDYVNYKNSKFRLFICGASKEYEFVKKEFGYPKDYVKLLGFSRFDALYHKEINKKQIVIMPTWRSYLINEKIDFKNTEYFQKYNSLLHNKNLIQYIEKNDIKIYFYLHRKMQKFESYFKSDHKNIIIVHQNEIDIQQLIQSSALLVTDYSSVSLDFAYMNKPVIYYQFDRDEFIQNHLKQGYFSYLKDGFGKVIFDEDNLVNKMISYSIMDYRLEKFYQKRIDCFFDLRDQNNNFRIYQTIKEL